MIYVVMRVWNRWSEERDIRHENVYFGTSREVAERCMVETHKMRDEGWDVWGWCEVWENEGNSLGETSHILTRIIKMSRMTTMTSSNHTTQ